MMLQIEILRQKIIDARKAYYESDSPIMSDAEFDFLEEEYKKLNPEDEISKEVGTPYQSGIWKKVLHPQVQGSLNKTKTEQDFKDWWKKTEIACRG